LLAACNGRGESDTDDSKMGGGEYSLGNKRSKKEKPGDSDRVFS